MEWAAVRKGKKNYRELKQLREYYFYMILFYFIFNGQTTKQRRWFYFISFLMVKLQSNIGFDKNKLPLYYTWPMQYFFDTFAIIPFFDDQSIYLIYEVKLW